MKKLILLLAIFISFITNSQDISGKWFGVLSVQGMQLNLNFNVLKSDSGYSSTMDSPEQKAFAIPTTTTTFENNVLKITIAKIEYEGTLKDGQFVGNFKQSGLVIPMNLSRNVIEKEKINRPQEPTKPYPYYTEDVVFENVNAGITLSGTLSMPSKEGNFPVAVLISGSGPQTRDEALLGHKPFLVLADFLTKNGIAVLRYDDRGTGESKGVFATATTYDFATDVEAAVKYLETRKEINKNKIGLIGHSEGGVIAPIVASKSKNINFIVMLAGTGISGDQLMLLQKKLIEQKSGESEINIEKGQKLVKGAYDIILKSEKCDDNFKNKLTEYFSKNSDEKDNTDRMVSMLSSPWFFEFIKYNPAVSLEKVRCPVLALNGSNDLQVPAKENLEAIKKALEKGKNTKFVVKEMPKMNHLFQECETGLPDEYGKIETTISPIALNEILNWIKIQVK